MSFDITMKRYRLLETIGVDPSAQVEIIAEGSIIGRQYFRVRVRECGNKASILLSRSELKDLVDAGQAILDQT